MEESGVPASTAFNLGREKNVRFFLNNFNRICPYLKKIENSS